MKVLKNSLFFILSTFVFISPSWALKGVLATPAEIERLKQDLVEGKIQIGITRLSELINEYGEPTKKIDADRKLTLEYGDLKIEFGKKRYWREWGYDSFKKPAYTDKIKLLRQKLESQKITGENIPLEEFVKDYDEPTEIYLTADDAQISVYYYGDMRLTFENVFTLTKWEAKDLSGSGVSLQTASTQSPVKDALSSAPAPAPAKAAAPAK